MPQLTNLNTFPYFDDFDESKKFHKVLFKPGQPVQARELTTIQSILQNQIEKFGNHVFKDGSVVIPGTLAIRPGSVAYELERSFNGLDVKEYIKSFLGKTIVGEDSGVKASVEYVDGYHIFVNFTSAGTDKEIDSFEVGETLITVDTVAITDSAISSFNAGSKIATINEVEDGCIARITDGVFYLRGNFVNVDQQTITVSLYEGEPTCKLGFSVQETLVTAYDDETLYDNSQGFANYAAPGADRIKIEAKLKPINIAVIETAIVIRVA